MGVEIKYPSDENLELSKFSFFRPVRSQMQKWSVPLMGIKSNQSVSFCSSGVDTDAEIKCPSDENLEL